MFSQFTLSWIELSVLTKLKYCY
ncbi:hypothetical protein CY0110_18147 [Crocosphaera chwakensis CCY0110]|uniref:Uncharacterized protein n=1 Tax=Crocosphaera chwakensis CCY0110 TaxID=391612 RepID=A3IIW1_9CHRO|nr:hypothetical protein CY0110_18147 [Crocosphaera chwakensis CCY0110]